MTPLEQMGDSDGTGIDMHQFIETDVNFVGPPTPTEARTLGLVNYEGRFYLSPPEVKRVKGRFEDHYDP